VFTDFAVAQREYAHLAAQVETMPPTEDPQDRTWDRPEAGAYIEEDDGDFEVRAWRVPISHTPPSIPAEKAGPRMLEAAEALALLPDGDMIHTFTGRGSIAFGADWDRAGIEDLIRQQGATIAEGQAKAMGHGLVVWREPGRKDPLFVETRAGS
jgi:hypothetical protein